MADFVTEDTGSTIQVTCKDKAGVVINLTGSTVKLQWKDDTGTLVSKTMTVTTPSSGIATYKFIAGELQDPGMSLEVQITDSSGFILTNTDLIVVDVRKELG